MPIIRKPSESRNVTRSPLLPWKLGLSIMIAPREGFNLAMLPVLNNRLERSVENSRPQLTQEIRKRKHPYQRARDRTQTILKVRLSAVVAPDSRPFESCALYRALIGSGMANEQPVDSGPQIEGEKGGQRRVVGTETKRRAGLAILCEAFGAMAIAVGASTNNWISFVFTLSGLLCGARGVQIQLQNRNFRHSVARNWAVALVLVGIAGWVGIKFDELLRRDHKPRLKLLLFSTSQHPFVNLELTNDFIRPSTHPITVSEDGGYLVAPVRKGQTNITLIFMLQNDSQSIVEKAAAKMAISTEIGWSVAPGWKATQPDDDHFRFAVTRINPLLPGDGDALPPITFQAGLNKHFALVFGTKARGVDFQEWAFWVTFPELPEELHSSDFKPQLVRGKVDPVTKKITIPAKGIYHSPSGINGGTIRSPE